MQNEDLNYPGDSKNQGGRPTKYKPSFAKQAYSLSLLGLTQDELAQFFEVSVSTIKEWMNTYPKFSAAIKEGGIISVGKTTVSLYKRANGYSHPSEEIKVLTKLVQNPDTGDWCTTQVIERIPTIKHYPPDSRAIEFFIRNKSRNLKNAWIDKDPEPALEATDKEPVQVVINVGNFRKSNDEDPEPEEENEN